MEKSPYDFSVEESSYRNERQLKEEIAQYEKNIEILDAMLGKIGMSMEEVRQSPIELAGQEMKNTLPSPMDLLREKKKPKRFPQKNWIPI